MIGWPSAGLRLEALNNFAPPLLRLLQAAGFEYLRAGKGDHQIWWQPATGRRLIVDTMIKSRHTANAVLKQAGLPKTF